MTQEIQAGALVRLRSGGPLMTVNEIEPRGENNSRADCQYFAADGFHAVTLRLTSLVQVEPDYAVKKAAKAVLKAVDAYLANGDAGARMNLEAARSHLALCLEAAP